MAAFRAAGATATRIGNGSSPPGEAIRGPSRSSTALNPEPTAQTDPSRSLSFAFGTALPARTRSLPAGRWTGTVGWKCVIPDLLGLGRLGFNSGHSPRPATQRISQQNRWQIEGQVQGGFVAPRSPPARATVERMLGSRQELSAARQPS